MTETTAIALLMLGLGTYLSFSSDKTYLAGQIWLISSIFYSKFFL
jgi:hypothetical protein